MPEPFEVLTMGRIGVDIYPLQIGVGAATRSRRFGKFLGGSADQRRGRRGPATAGARAVITRTGDDPFGDVPARRRCAARRRRPLRHRRSTDLPTPVTFCEIFPPDDFPLYFYRLPKAPDLEIHADELDLDAIRDARRLLGRRSPACPRSRAAARTLAALEARGPRAASPSSTSTTGRCSGRRARRPAR